MQVIFTDKFLEKVYNDEDYNSKGYHPDILEAMVDAVDALHFASDLNSLKASHSLQCKQLDGIYKKYNIYRIKLTRGRRLFFRLEKDGSIQIINILDMNNHDINLLFEKQSNENPKSKPPRKTPQKRIRSKRTKPKSFFGAYW